VAFHFFRARLLLLPLLLPLLLLPLLLGFRERSDLPDPRTRHRWRG
jgi:hypothetical protein